MKKWLLALLTFVCVSASAVGPYDGIYQRSGSSTEYFSVHQNGTTLIVASFFTLGWVGVGIDTPGGLFVPNRTDLWELYRGEIYGASTTVTGETYYGICSAKVRMVFDSTGVDLTIQSVTATAEATAQLLTCTQPPPDWFRYVKVF